MFRNFIIFTYFDLFTNCMRVKLFLLIVYGSDKLCVIFFKTEYVLD